MGKKTKELKVDDDIKLISTELDVCDSIDLIADIMGPLAPAGAAWNTGAHAGDAIGMLARELTGGGLTRNLIRLLSCTTLVCKSEQLKVELIDSREKFNQAFAGRAKYVAPAVKLAVEVSLSGFLDGLELIGIKKPTLAKPSGLSIQNTNATG